MTYEERFLKDFKDWIESQVSVNEIAMKTSQDVWETDSDERAREAYLRYEAKLDAYQFIMGKFDNYQAGKEFHDLPEGLFGERTY